MSKDWDRINEALLSAAQGKTPTPVVSRRSLFGIPSAVELKMQAIVAEVARGAEDPAAREKAQKLREKLDVAADALGGRLTVGRASCYFVFRARSAGYDIPAYPFAGSGELKEFLHDQGVASVPEWYEGLGIGTSDFVALDAHALVSFQHEAGKFRVALFDGVSFVDDSRFCPLAGSACLANAGYTSLESLAGALDVVLDVGAGSGQARQAHEEDKQL